MPYSAWPYSKTTMPLTNNYSLIISQLLLINSKKEVDYGLNKLTLILICSLGFGGIFVDFGSQWSATVASNIKSQIRQNSKRIFTRSDTSLSVSTSDWDWDTCLRFREEQVGRDGEKCDYSVLNQSLWWTYSSDGWVAECAAVPHCNDNLWIHVFWVRMPSVSMFHKSVYLKSMWSLFS